MKDTKHPPELAIPDKQSPDRRMKKFGEIRNIIHDTKWREAENIRTIFLPNKSDRSEVVKDPIIFPVMNNTGFKII